MICNSLLEMKISNETLRQMFERNPDLARANPSIPGPPGGYSSSIKPPSPLPCMVINEASVAKCMTIRDTTDQAKLNKTERAYWEHLKQSQMLDGSIQWIGVQNITFKLADDCRLTCDFFIIRDGRLIAIDTKGSFVREDSQIKLKVAARLFPWIKFLIVRRSNYGWNEEEVKP